MPGAYEGRAYLPAGLHASRRRPARGEAALSGHATKQRSLILADGALTSVRTRAIDTARHIASEAVRLLATADSATARIRLAAVRQELDRWNDHRGVKQLNPLLTPEERPLEMRIALASSERANR